MEYLIWGIALLVPFTLGFYFGFQSGRTNANKASVQTVKQLREVLEAQIKVNDKIKEAVTMASRQKRSKRLGADSLDLDC